MLQKTIAAARANTGPESGPSAGQVMPSPPRAVAMAVVIRAPEVQVLSMHLSN
jgi:hypothetical protein